MENSLFTIAYASYSICTLLYLTYLFTKSEKFSRWAFTFLVIALTTHLGSLALRTMIVRAAYLQQAQVLRTQGNLDAAASMERAAHVYVPWNNWFESFSFFGAIIALIYFVIAWNTAIPILGAFIMPISWGLLTMALFSDRTIHPMVPSLNRYWMSVHVPVMFTSYAILGIAFAVGIAYLLEEHQMKSKHPGDITYRLPALEDLDRLIYRLIQVAFPILTVGIFVGGLWAYSAWGRFWSWDPKETWTLITWLVYVVYLTLRWFGGWRGRKTAYLSLAGFAFVLFTYVGVNYLSPLHGFLSSAGR